MDKRKDGSPVSGTDYGWSGYYDIPGAHPSELSNAIRSAVENVGEGPVVIADFGCGSARTLGSIPPDRKQVCYIGFDINASALTQARSKASSLPHVQAEFCVADLSKPIDFGQNRERADIVVSSRVIHALPTRQSALQFLKNMKGIVKPGGGVIVTAGSTRDWKQTDYTQKYGRPTDYFVNYAEVMELPLQVGQEDFHMHLFEDGELEDLVRNAGLHVFRKFQYQDLSGYQHLRNRNLNSYIGVEAIRPKLLLSVR